MGIVHGFMGLTADLWEGRVEVFFTIGVNPADVVQENGILLFGYQDDIFPRGGHISGRGGYDP